MGQNTTNPYAIGEMVLEVADQFTYLGSTISSNLSLDYELNRWIGKAKASHNKHQGESLRGVCPQHTAI